MKVIILPNDEKTPDENVGSTMRMIGGVPILMHTIMMFKRYGFDEFWICDTSSSHQIRDCLNANKEKLRGIKLRIFKAPPTMKSGKLISICRKKGLENTFFIAPNDVITDLNIEKMLSYHRQNARVATVCIAEEKKYFAALGINSNEKYEAKIVNSGFYIFEEEAADYIDGNVTLERDAIINMAENDELSVYLDSHFVQRCI